MGVLYIRGSQHVSQVAQTDSVGQATGRREDRQYSGRQIREQKAGQQIRKEKGIRVTLWESAELICDVLKDCPAPPPLCVLSECPCGKSMQSECNACMFIPYLTAHWLPHRKVHWLFWGLWHVSSLGELLEHVEKNDFIDLSSRFHVILDNCFDAEHERIVELCTADTLLGFKIYVQCFKISFGTREDECVRSQLTLLY